MVSKLINLDLQRLVSSDLSQDELIQQIDHLLTEQKNQAQFYKAEFERLNVIIDIIPSTISWINRDLTYFGVNKSLADACGMNPKDFYGKIIGFHTQEKFFFDFAKDLFSTNARTIYRELEVKISEVMHYYLVTGTKLDDNNRAVVIGVDITELNQLRGHISYTEKLATLGEMFAGIIHDINNPLMMIEGSAKRIKKMVDTKEVQDIADKIEMSSKKISKIVQGIKIYIRQDGQQPFQLEDLGLILDDSVVICENKLKDHNVKFEFDITLRKIMIKCNFTQVFQVFVNLISNSVDAINTLPEKWIKIKLVSEDETKVIIHFQDSGAGIPLNIQEKIFNAFFTTKERGIGSGLGLSLCTKILEAHGGKLSIDNNQPNTTFVIELKKN
jgi:signal transduction histidine kinase